MMQSTPTQYSCASKLIFSNDYSKLTRQCLLRNLNQGLGNGEGSEFPALALKAFEEEGFGYDQEEVVWNNCDVEDDDLPELILFDMKAK